MQKIDIKVPISCPNCMRIVKVVRVTDQSKIKRNVACPNCSALGFDWKFSVDGEAGDPVCYLTTTFSGMLSETGTYNNARFHLSNT